MNKTTLLVIVFLSVFFSINAQYELDWNARIGGLNHNDSRGIVKSGNFIYSTGRIESSTQFESSTVFSTETSSGMDDIYISKMDLNGNYIWVKTMGGTDSEQGVDIEIGPSGDVYIIGFFKSIFDFDPGAGTSTLTPVGEKDIFVARFSPVGDLVWVKQFSGTLTEQAEGITILSDGVIVSGRFKGTVDFDPSAASANLTSNGNNDAFVVKLDLNGDYVWAKNYGSTANDVSWDVTSDDSDNIYVTGQYRNTVEFEAGNTASQITSNGNNDVFILKLNTSGAYQWVKSIGGTGTDIGSKIVLDNQNNIYVTGFFSNMVSFDPAGSADYTSNGAKDAFIVKYDNNAAFVFAKSVGSTAGDDKGKSIAFDLDNNIYQVGVFSGTIDINGTTHVSNGLTDCFVHKMNASGNSIWSATYGGSADDFLNGIVVDADTSIYFNGKFSSDQDIDPSANDSIVSSLGDNDGYIFKWKKEVVLVSSITVQGQGGVSMITIPAGTLQMEANILPINATDGTYTWSVVNQTGSASISTSGLLTAISNGTVEVVATANDASGLSGSAIITITNQNAGLNEFTNSSLVLYPNPAKNEIHVLNIVNEASVELFSIAGERINTQFYLNNSELVMNISSLEKGVYLLKVNEKTIRFIKE